MGGVDGTYALAVVNAPLFCFVAAHVVGAVLLGAAGLVVVRHGTGWGARRPEPPRGTGDGGKRGARWTVCSSPPGASDAVGPPAAGVSP